MTQATPSTGSILARRWAAAGAARDDRELQLNLTPLIDVVFLLIVFFMLICQFIRQESDRLLAPDDITGAQAALDRTAPVVLAAFPTDAEAGATGAVTFTLGPQQWRCDRDAPESDQAALADGLAGELAVLLAERPDATVYLRCDRRLPYARVQVALDALRQAGARHIELAVYRGDWDAGSKPAKETP